MSTAEEFEDDFDDMYDDDEGGISGFVILLIGLAILAIFAALVFFAYQQGIRNAQTPTLAADPGPARVEQTIDLGASPREQEVFDELERAPATEVLADATDDTDPLAGFDETVSAAANTARSEPAPVAPANDPVTTEPEEDPVASSARPVPTVTQTAPPAPVRADPVISTALAAPTSGTHVVQVVATRSNEEAMAYYDRMQRDLGAMLDGKGPDIERADLGSRGVFYRLRIGPFSSKESASNYCKRLKGRGQDCLVKAL